MTTRRRREPVGLPKVGRDASLRELLLSTDAHKAGFIARARAEWREHGVVARASNMGTGYTEVLTRSARPDTPYQITHLDANGEPWGHAEPKTLEEAFETLRSYAKAPRRVAKIFDPVPRSQARLVHGRLVRL